MTQIKAENLCFHYPGRLPVLAHLGFTFGLPSDARPGSVVGLMGPSGSGKSTLLRLFAGLEKPSSGLLSINPLPEVVPYLTQDTVLFQHYSRRQNALYRSFAGSYTARFKPSDFRDLQRALGLSDGFLIDKRPLDPMSGGERQRLALLRDMSIAPDLLLLDEPCTGLDQPVKVEFIQQLRSLVEARRVLIIYVTHHRDEVEMVADQIAFLEPAIAGTAQRLTIGSASAVLAAPPSLLAASLLADPVCNTVVCELRSDGVLCPMPWRQPGAPPDRTAVIAFGLQGAKFAADGGPVEVLARGSVVSYVRLGPHTPPLAIEGTPASACCLRIEGPGWLFENPASQAQPGYFSTCPKDPYRCLRFQQSS